MSPESRIGQNVLGGLPTVLDRETMYMSGGFNRLANFQTVLEHGEEGLPELLEGLQSGDSGTWWRMEAIWTIAGIIEKPIEYPQEIAGRHDAVRDHTIDWAKTHGYLPVEA